ncbi:hypothetical protein C2S51_013821 [Perilla frutescens var. frutescens]|nr:hypothetical protein C2S51_013821 [Perilla frutescens var. frutescens]
MHHKVVLFGCDWVSKGKRLKKDCDGFTVANFTNVKRHEEPFILASQATQVFYIADPVDNNEHVVISTVARGVYNMQPLADVETYLQSNICNSVLNDESEEVSWVREDVEGV